MNRTLLTSAVCTLAGALIASADVPSLINYQGRLTDSSGAPVTGSKTFAISIYDAATAGNLLYSESIGAVTLDSNGVYSFQFGNAGTSNTQVTETIGTTAGSTLTYTKTLTNTPVVANSITVTDGTNSWSQSVGNPGVGATATANTIVGFVIGATITNGGSGYTSAPAVTITGAGSGATATATLTGGVVTGITINNAGSGYTGAVTITIAPPVIPFRVDYSSGAITATYSSAPTVGRTISATYRYGTNGISAAFAGGAEHWMAITVDGVTQGTRQRVLAVPFAQKATVADRVLDPGLLPQANGADSALITAEQIKAGITANLIDSNKLVEYFTLPQGAYSSVDVSKTTSAFGLNGGNYYRSYSTETVEEGTSQSYPYQVEVSRSSNSRLRFIYFYGSKAYSNSCSASCVAEITYADGSKEVLSDQMSFPFGSGSNPEFQPQVKYIKPSKPNSYVSSVKIVSSGSSAMSRKIILVWNSPTAIELIQRPGFFEPNANYRIVVDSDTKLNSPPIELSIEYGTGSVLLPSDGSWISLPSYFDSSDPHAVIRLKNSLSTSAVDDYTLLRGIVILKSKR